MFLLKQKKKNQTGSIIMLIIIFTSLFIGIMGAILSLFVYQNRLSRKLQAKETAMQIAEAGINYYRWHLAHTEEDYADGTGDSCDHDNPCGPYDHDYHNHLEEKIGVFRLYITPPTVGSTIVTIKSIGWVEGYEKQTRVIEVKYGIRSLATYSFLTSSDVWFGETESVIGPLHSNGGIRMDGDNSSIVTSAQLTYICTPKHDCSDEEKPGIWGTGSGSELWHFPTTLVDFNTISLDLAQMKIDAQTASGIHYPNSGAEGYRIIFKNDGTLDVYKVESLMAAVQQLNDNWTDWEQKADEPNTQTFLTNEPTPANGIIFIEDNVWVEGTVSGRFTLVSAKLTGIPADYTTIRIDNNINYSERDGSNALGLIAEKDIKVPNYAPDVLTIDAIMLAQNGRVFHNRYNTPSLKTSIEVYGSIITNEVWTWNWCSGEPCITYDGYDQTTSIYDNNTAFAPPPYFPTTGKYTFISWEEKIAGEL
jgi:hypothetical protein